MGWDIVAIGTNHNLPVEDPIKTAERLSTLVDSPISVGYYESWIYKSEDNSIIRANYDWIELKKVNSQKSGPTIVFSIEGYCARKLYTELAETLDSVKFADKEDHDWFISEATDIPFAVYECEYPYGALFDFRICKENVDFNCRFPGRWFQFVSALIAPRDERDKNYIMEFRQHIFNQLKTCGCDTAYYFADQGAGGCIFDAIDKPSKEWIKYLESGEYIKDRAPVIVEVQKLIDRTLILSNGDWIDCFIDNFHDLNK